MELPSKMQLAHFLVQSGYLDKTGALYLAALRLTVLKPDAKEVPTIKVPYPLLQQLHRVAAGKHLPGRPRYSARG